jgi:hypothetical protein
VVKRSDNKFRLSEQSGKEFEGCDICNNVSVLLSHPKLTAMQKDIVRGYKEIHLRRQYEARLRLENKIVEATQFDQFGHPKAALLLFDAMTEWSSTYMRAVYFVGLHISVFMIAIIVAQTPKLEDAVKGPFANKKMTNRLVGVEVVCGHIHETFFYVMDNIHSKDQNANIEIMRLGTYRFLYDVTLLYFAEIMSAAKFVRCFVTYD